MRYPLQPTLYMYLDDHEEFPFPPPEPPCSAYDEALLFQDLVSEVPVIDEDLYDEEVPLPLTMVPDEEWGV